MNEPITVSVPIYIQVTKKKPFALNLNIYRNAHFRTLSKAKIMFDDLMKPILSHLPKMTQVELTYTLFFGSRRSIDVSNVCSIVDKFFSDSLVNHGYIPDDNIDHISNVNYRFGGIDTTNPRVEVTLSNMKIEEEDMKITIVQTEIEQAINDFIMKQINIRENQKIIIDLKATRGEDGFVADIDIVNEAVEPTPAKKPVTRSVEAPVEPKAEKVVAEEPKKGEAPVKANISSGDEDRVEPAKLGMFKVAEPKEKEEVATKPEAPKATSGTTATLFGNLTKPVNEKTNKE